MFNILIDYSRIIEPHDLPLLKERISPIPDTKFSLGVVLNISENSMKTLDKKQKGLDKIYYMNTDSFVNSISSYSYLNYDKKQRICELMGSEGGITPTELKSALSNALSSIPNDVTLWIGTRLDDPNFDRNIKSYIDNDFHDPYITDRSPLGHIFGENALCMFRKNDIVDNNATVDVNYVISQFMANSGNKCTLYVKLSDASVKYLRQLSKMGSTWNGDENITQKEMAGQMVMGKVNNIHGRIVYDLDVVRDSVVSGDEEGVEIIGGLYNFHSHPKEAYERHEVKLGWPSAQDYIGFLASSLIHDTILHIVSSIEGFYVVSLSKYWADHKPELEGNETEWQNFIAENFNIYYESGNTSTWYVNTVNNIKYKTSPLFLVQFFPWDRAATEFTVPYQKNGDNCFVRQTTYDKYNEYHRDE